MDCLAFSTSLRRESVNRKLLHLALECGKSLGLNAETIDLRDYELPAYSQEIQDSTGISDGAKRFGDRLARHSTVMIASPEYNFSFPGHFKNLFDWVSRIQPMPWDGKVVLLLSASPSMVGGNRGLWQLRVPFEACGSIVYPEMFSLGKAYDAFEASGSLKDASTQQRLMETVSEFVRFAKAVSRKEMQ